MAGAFDLALDDGRLAARRGQRCGNGSLQLIAVAHIDGDPLTALFVGRFDDHGPADFCRRLQRGRQALDHPVHGRRQPGLAQPLRGHGLVGAHRGSDEWVAAGHAAIDALRQVSPTELERARTEVGERDGHLVRHPQDRQRRFGLLPQRPQPRADALFNQVIEGVEMGCVDVALCGPCDQAQRAGHSDVVHRVWQFIDVGQANLGLPTARAGLIGPAADDGGRIEHRHPRHLQQQAGQAQGALQPGARRRGQDLFGCAGPGCRGWRQIQLEHAVQPGIQSRQIRCGRQHEVNRQTHGQLTEPARRARRA